MLIGVLPFFHIYGMQVIMNQGLRAGATIVTMPRFDLEQFLSLISEHGVTRAYVVPPIVLALAKHPAIDDADLSSIETIMSGAAPLGAELSEKVAERIGCTVIQGYGMTETSPVTHVIRPDGENRAGSIGPPLADTECRLVDPESGEDVAAGERGELWIRGPQVMAGYHENDEATASTIDGDGWLHTGDIAVVDDAGFFEIVDRLKELIKYKGFQVAPAELEALVINHPTVADVAVIGVADEECGELPKAYIVPAGDDFDADELCGWVAEQVSPQKKIRLVETIDEIPKSPQRQDPPPGAHRQGARRSLTLIGLDLGLWPRITSKQPVCRAREDLDDMARFVGDLGVGEAERGHAGGGVGLVSAAVGCLLGRGAVKAPAVGLDDESEVGPEEVDAVAVDVLLGQGRWEPRLLPQGTKAALKR